MKDIRDIKMNKLDDNFFTNNMFLNTNVFNKIYADKQKQQKNKLEIERLRKSSKLKPFGDADKDSIPNIFDKHPFTKDKNNKKWRMLR